MSMNQFDDKISIIMEDLDDIEKNADSLNQQMSDTSRELDELYAKLGLKRDKIIDDLATNEARYDWVDSLNNLNTALKEKVHGISTIGVDSSLVDVVVASGAGLVASIIDIFLVGTPEIVKIYHGGENFDGSILTGVLRKLGKNDSLVSAVSQWCSDNCKVSYDVSAVKGVVYPNNHRLRNPAHDPLFGLAFAVLDMKFETATLIDNEGNFRIIKNSNDRDTIGALEAVLYYIGHLVSDVFTARGIPVPGFFMTQFFTDGVGNRSIAKIAEEMYLDGYDARHFVSMSVPVAVKNLIIYAYLKMTEEENYAIISSITERELAEMQNASRQIHLMMVSDAVACGGNALKFFLPPTAGNLTALNLCEWMSLLTSSIRLIQYETRDTTVEEIMKYRKTINNHWMQFNEDIDLIEKDI